MAQATYHSDRGTKSALLLVKANKFVFVSTPVYVPREAVEGMELGATFEIPDGYKLIPLTDEDGTPRKTKDGAVLNMLAY